MKAAVSHCQPWWVEEGSSMLLELGVIILLSFLYVVSLRATEKAKTFSSNRDRGHLVIH